MGPKDLAVLLPSMLDTGVPIYLWGPPGICKSSLVRQVAAQKYGENDAFIDIRAATLDPVDIRGVPAIEGNVTRWCTPSFLPADATWQGIIFLDELAQAAPLVQSALLQLTLDRRVGDYVLPDGAVIVAASNRQEDRAGTHRLISPLLNRFIHLDVDASFEDWVEWAAKNNIAQEVRSYLRWQSADLLVFEPKNNPRSFPTPRSWEFVSKVIQSVPEHLQKNAVFGAIGLEIGAKFIAFLEHFQKIPKKEDIVAQPATLAIPTQPPVQYAMCGALANYVKGASTKEARALVTYALRLGDEFTVLAMKEMVGANETLATLAEVGDWYKKNLTILRNAK